MMLRTSALLLVCLLMVFAGTCTAAECKAVEGDYVLNLSGFGGGANYYYPVAMIGNITVKDGDVTGNYKIHVAAQQSTPVNRNVTGHVSVKKCVGTLKLEINDQLLHTFTVVVNADGNFALATGEVGLVVNGTATK